MKRLINKIEPVRPSSPTNFNFQSPNDQYRPNTLKKEKPFKQEMRPDYFEKSEDVPEFTYKPY